MEGTHIPVIGGLRISGLLVAGDLAVAFLQVVDYKKELS
jgi:hypothetical protein